MTVMKKYLLMVVVAVASLVLGVSTASADSDNAAIVVKSDISTNTKSLIGGVS